MLKRSQLATLQAVRRLEPAWGGSFPPRHMRRLEMAGLVRRTPGGWWCATLKGKAVLLMLAVFPFMVEP